MDHIPFVLMKKIKSPYYQVLNGASIVFETYRKKLHTSLHVSFSSHLYIHLSAGIFHYSTFLSGKDVANV